MTETKDLHTPVPWHISNPRHDPEENHIWIHQAETMRTVFDSSATEAWPMSQADREFLLRAVNCHAELLEALRGLFEHCTMIHKHWGDGSNLKQADDAIAAARAAIAKVTARSDVKERVFDES